MSERVDRRKFITGVIGGAVGGLIVGFAGGYLSAPAKAIVKTVTATKTTTIGGGAPVTETVTKTVVPTEVKPEEMPLPPEWEQMRDEQKKWLKEVGSKYAGHELLMTSEATPPSRAIQVLTDGYFTPLTGIKVTWELTPLEHVLEKITMETSTRAGKYSHFYQDQAWIARFHKDTVDPRTMWKEHPELTLPHFMPEDFLPPLVEHIAMFPPADKMVGIVCDIPIFLTIFRKDIFDKEGLPIPKDPDTYMEVVKKINDKYAPETYGTTGQLKGGHYSLYCDWTWYHWTHGAGHYAAGTGEPIVNEPEGVDALNYLLELMNYMPPGVTTWDWSGEAESFAAGRAAIYSAWGEFFPMYDTPAKSKIVGLADSTTVPKEYKLRDPKTVAYLEMPRAAHQGGSIYALSAYTKERDAGWIFLQWATNWDTQALSSVLGGGASPVRKTSYIDPRVTAKYKVCPGTTRHFLTTYESIMYRMGTEPHYPEHPEVADMIAHALADLFAGKFSDAKSTLDFIAKRMKEIVKTPVY